METKEATLPMGLTKKYTSYKIIIPQEVERIIRFLCDKVHDTEWSGVLFYTPIGSFEDDNLEIHCKDILPMDIGTATYTEFNMSPDVISYMAENPELLDCKTGLIHSHNNMTTFFSGTDLQTLYEEGKDMNHFVSLIVNNAGKYTAAITRKVQYKTVTEITYNGFDGTRLGREEMEGEEIQYFNLNIVFEGVNNNQFDYISTRIDEIKKNKEASKASPIFANANSNNSQYRYSDYYNKYTYNKVEPTLFDDIEPKQTKQTVLEPYKEPMEFIPDDIIEKIINQLITGSVTITKLESDSKIKLINSIEDRFVRRFGAGTAGIGLFRQWAIDFIEFLLWYSYENEFIDDDLITSEIAGKTIEALKKLPKNKFIDEYIDIISSYEPKL